METIFDRLKLIVEKERITFTQLERIAGASKGAFRKSTNIGTQWIQRLVEYFPQYNSDWILIGRGNMTFEDQPILKDSNEYLVKRFEEVIKDLEKIKEEVKRKDVVISKQAEKIARLENEKKENHDYGMVAEPKP